MTDRTNQPQIDQVQFLHQLATCFNIGEMNTLCFTLEIKYDDLGGVTRTDIARELIEYAERRGRLRELLDAAKAERPHVDWSGVETVARTILPTVDSSPPAIITTPELTNRPMTPAPINPQSSATSSPPSSRPEEPNETETDYVLPADSDFAPLEDKPSQPGWKSIFRKYMWVFILVLVTSVLLVGALIIRSFTSVPPALDPRPTLTPPATPPVCSPPHPPLPGSSISGSISVTYVPIPVMSDCLEIKEQLPKFQVSWSDVPEGTELWVLVYSPQTQLYFPHYCTRIQNPTGGQECRVTLLREEPYDIVFVLANAASHSVLQANSMLTPQTLPDGLAEKFSIQVVRTE